MSTQQWYDLVTAAGGIIMVVMIAFAIWYCITLWRDLETGAPQAGLVVCGLLIIALLVPRICLESKLYPAGQCPNCDKQITARYCEDCGWKNDSYYEITDRD